MVIRMFINFQQESFSTLGGNDHNNMVREILRKWCHYSGSGKKLKKAFVHLRLYRTLVSKIYYAFSQDKCFLNLNCIGSTLLQ